jgi:hypothetical protein
MWPYRLGPGDPTNDLATVVSGSGQAVRTMYDVIRSPDLRLSFARGRYAATQTIRLDCHCVREIVDYVEYEPLNLE